MQCIEFMPYMFNYGNLGALLTLVYVNVAWESQATCIGGSSYKIPIFLYFMVIYYSIMGKRKKLSVRFTSLE